MADAAQKVSPVGKEKHDWTTIEWNVPKENFGKFLLGSAIVSADLGMLEPGLIKKLRGAGGRFLVGWAIGETAKDALSLVGISVPEKLGNADGPVTRLVAVAPYLAGISAVFAKNTTEGYAIGFIVDKNKLTERQIARLNLEIINFGKGVDGMARRINSSLTKVAREPGMPLLLGGEAAFEKAFLDIARLQSKGEKVLADLRKELLGAGIYDEGKLDAVLGRMGSLSSDQMRDELKGALKLGAKDELVVLPESVDFALETAYRDLEADSEKVLADLRKELLGAGIYDEGKLDAVLGRMGSLSSDQMRDELKGALKLGAKDELVVLPERTNAALETAGNRIEGLESNGKKVLADLRKELLGAGIYDEGKLDAALKEMGAVSEDVVREKLRGALKLAEKDGLIVLPEKALRSCVEAAIKEVKSDKNLRGLIDQIVKNAIVGETSNELVRQARAAAYAKFEIAVEKSLRAAMPGVEVAGASELVRSDAEAFSAELLERMPRKTAGRQMFERASSRLGDFKAAKVLPVVGVGAGLVALGYAVGQKTEFKKGDYWKQKGRDEPKVKSETATAVSRDLAVSDEVAEAISREALGRDWGHMLKGLSEAKEISLDEVIGEESRFVSVDGQGVSKRKGAEMGDMNAVPLNLPEGLSIIRFKIECERTKAATYLFSANGRVADISSGNMKTLSGTFEGKLMNIKVKSINGNAVVSEDGKAYTVVENKDKLDIYTRATIGIKRAIAFGVETDDPGTGIFPNKSLDASPLNLHVVSAMDGNAYLRFNATYGANEGGLLVNDKEPIEVVIVFDNRPSENRAAFVAVAYDKDYACTGSGICRYRKGEKGLNVVSGGGYNAGDQSKHYGIDMTVSAE